MKHPFLYALLSLFGMSAMAQTSGDYFLIKGRVVDALTRQPLQGASVFAEQTTLGTATDADGVFVLKLPSGGFDLIISFSGYQTITDRISPSAPPKAEYALSPREKVLQEVSIVSTGEVKNGWEKYGNVFTAEFLGRSPNADSCRILNPEVLRFFYSKRKNRLRVLASEPLLIENRALGYLIRYELDSLVHEYGNEQTVYTGYPRFEELTPTDELCRLRWTNLRHRQYPGSLLHFMRALHAGTLEEERFEIQFLVEFQGRDSALVLKDPYAAMNWEETDSAGPVRIKPNQPQVGILYKGATPLAAYQRDNPEEPSAFQFSVMRMRQPGTHLQVEGNGFYFEQDEVSFSGYWSWSRMADALPYDYVE